MQSRFQITVSPGEPLPLPPREAMFGELFVDGDEEYWDFGGLDRPFGEAYLELEAVDLSSIDQIIEFVERWHPLSVKQEGPSFSLGYHGFPLATGFYEVAEHAQLFGDPDPFKETVLDFTLGAKCLRDMTTAWRVLSGQIDENDAVWLTPCWSNSVDPHEAVARNKQPATPERVLRHGFEFSLARFAPRVNFTMDDRLVDPEIVEDIEGDKVPRFNDPTLVSIYGSEIPFYCVCCLELFNHICESATYRRCSNEPCPKWFVRQSGTAKHGQNRLEGVKYCSPECKQAQAQREYRRRQSKKKKRPSSGD